MRDLKDIHAHAEIACTITFALVSLAFCAVIAVSIFHGEVWIGRRQPQAVHLRNDPHLFWTCIAGYAIGGILFSVLGVRSALARNRSDLP